MAVKSFITLATGTNPIKLFSIVKDTPLNNKLEWFHYKKFQPWLMFRLKPNKVWHYDNTYNDITYNDITLTTLLITLNTGDITFNDTTYNNIKCHSTNMFFIYCYK